MGDALTIVMYHFVRPIAGTEHAALPGLEVGEFAGQLAYLKRHHHLVTVEDVVDSVESGAPLPEQPALLTFDDGYADHARHVLPILHDEGVAGAFFPPAAAVLERSMLDVNRIHFVLASGADVRSLVKSMEQLVLAEGPREDVRPLDTYRHELMHANRFDPPEVIYLKRMLQHALPADLRASITSELFRTFVTEDEGDFADQLYLSVDDLCRMADEGMHIGLHGYGHAWLDQLTVDEQADDIDRALQMLVAVGLETDRFSFCYPYGGYTPETVELLRARGCVAAFTTVVGLAELPLREILELPRLDTKDLPMVADAPPARWTAAAGTYHESGPS